MAGLRTVQRFAKNAGQNITGSMIFRMYHLHKKRNHIKERYHMNTKERIIQLLETSTRIGVDELIGYLNENGFFTAPASTKFHGCYEGGLADHSLGVYDLLKEYYDRWSLGEVVSKGQKPLRLGPENIIFAALLHDVCKVGAYIGTEKPYTWNRSQPKGHACLSIERIKKYIELTPIEEMMIKFHMGVYGLHEFEARSGEYTLRSGGMANAWYHNPVVKLMYFCDELESFEAKNKERQSHE
jgi:23S rRNA maturation-related 3'-5' exoribonuclease YhaM